MGRRRRRVAPRRRAGSRAPANQGAAARTLAATVAVSVASVAIVTVGVAWVDGRRPGPSGRLSDALSAGDTHDGQPDDDCVPGIENPRLRGWK